MKEMTTRYKKSDLESYKEFKKLRKLGNNRPPRRSEWMSNESTLFFIHNNSPGLRRHWIINESICVFLVTNVELLNFVNEDNKYVFLNE